MPSNVRKSTHIDVFSLSFDMNIRNGWQAYTHEEDMAVVRFITKKNHWGAMGGNVLWKDMARLKVGVWSGLCVTPA